MKQVSPFGFRAPPEVKTLLDRAAVGAGRSINNQLLRYCVQGLRLDGFNVPNPRKGKRPNGCNRQGV